MCRANVLLNGGRLDKSIQSPGMESEENRPQHESETIFRASQTHHVGIWSSVMRRLIALTFYSTTLGLEDKHSPVASAVKLPGWDIANSQEHYSARLGTKIKDKNASFQYIILVSRFHVCRSLYGIYQNQIYASTLSIFFDLGIRLRGKINCELVSSWNLSDCEFVRPLSSSHSEARTACEI